MKDNLFDPKTLTLTAGKSVDIVVKNDGQAIHNMHILSEAKDGKDISSEAIVSPGKESKFTVKITKPGTYNFQCDYHVPDMVGTITVQYQAAPQPAGGRGIVAHENRHRQTSDENKVASTRR